MPTIISHGVAALALGKIIAFQRMPARFWILAAACSALPDIDVIGFGLGIGYGDLLGHRGLTHSPFFALIIAFFVVFVFFKDRQRFSSRWWMLVVFFFVVTASHGVLDAMTNGGRGVAFFAPFSNGRYFSPWRPIEVSPLGIDSFLSARGLEVMMSEFRWIWIPSGVVMLLAKFLASGSQRAPMIHPSDE
jgi:inner membrane protein